MVVIFPTAVSVLQFKSVDVVISSCNPVVEITPSVMSIFVLPVKSQDTTSSTILIFVPAVNSFCNPVAEMTPSVISIFVLPVKSQDTTSSTILMFVHKH